MKPQSSRSKRASTLRSRRAILGLALGTVLGSVGVPAGLAAIEPAPPRATTLDAVPVRRRRPPKRRFRVVTRAFTSAAPILINTKGPASPYPSQITVTGLKRGLLLDLNVTLHGFSHEWPQDVDVLLVAPNGASAVILSDVGSDDSVASNLTIVLDDQAPLPPGDSLVSGRYLPSNEGPDDAFPSWPGGTSPNVALATFRRINPNGRWKLFVVDDTSASAGNIAGWSLTIKARVRV